ncbi:MAG: hypothetical protein LQ351_002321 [Letrouitia transgressa]|nr:MAG: hypothetical protein LQ351_002321 [Letrouitia transgressa]
MAAPKPAIMPSKEIVHDTITLDAKPSASIHCSWVIGNDETQSSRTMIVFLNGLMAYKSSWLPVMAGIIRKHNPVGFPSLLAYDRYGQGMTEDRDPQDQGREKGYGHDLIDVVTDLQQLLVQFARSHLRSNLEDLRIVLVGNSIGCAIARLYAQTYPGFVSALLLLDSMMANSNFDWWPNPDAEGFNPKELSADVSIEVLREQRAKFAATFAPSAINKESLDRRNVAELLPKSDGPMLIGPGGSSPLVTVVGHDGMRFAEESLNESWFLMTSAGYGDTNIFVIKIYNPAVE